MLLQNVSAIFWSARGKAVKSLEPSPRFVCCQVSLQKFYLLLESLPQEQNFYQPKKKKKIYCWLASSSTHPLLTEMSYVFISQSYNQTTTCTADHWMSSKCTHLQPERSNYHNKFITMINQVHIIELWIRLNQRRCLGASITWRSIKTHAFHFPLNK